MDLKAFLNKIGVTDESIVSTITSGTPSSDIFTAAEALVFNTMQTRVRADKNFTDEIREDVKGKFFGEYKTKISKKFNLDINEVKEKNLDDVVDMAKSRYDEHRETNTNGLATITRERDEIMAKYNKLNDEQIPSMTAKHKEELANTESHYFVRSKLLETSVDKGAVDNIFEMVKGVLSRDGHTIKRDSAGYKIFNKENKPLRNDSGAEVSVDDFINKIVEPFTKPAGNEPPKRNPNIADPATQLNGKGLPSSKQSQGVSVAQANAERLQKLTKV